MSNILREQVQLASAKLLFCLKNAVLELEKFSFLRGLRSSFLPTLLMNRSAKPLKLDFLGIF